MCLPNFPAAGIGGTHVLLRCPTRAITWVIRWTRAEAMEAHSAVFVDLLQETLEELHPVFLSVAIGVVSLPAQDREELGTGLEEAAAFADRLEGAVEARRPGAVTIP